MNAAAVSGLVVVDKPAGLTSHTVVNRIRRLAGTKKVGHGGTLDPMATGVLLVGVARATRLLGHLALADKSYNATIRLGQRTTTDDAEGEVLAAASAAHLDADAVQAEVARLRGDLEQVPSSVSAIKVDGRRAYARVRAGEDVTLKARSVRVTRFDICEVRVAGDVMDLDVVIDCTTGTYIRALARDLGAALGVGGHLTALRRTAVGAVLETEAHTLEDLGEHGLSVMTMSQVARRFFDCVELTEEQAQEVRFGRRLGLRLPPGRPSALLGPGGDLLALYEAEDDLARAVAVFV